MQLSVLWALVGFFGMLHLVFTIRILFEMSCNFCFLTIYVFLQLSCNFRCFNWRWVDKRWFYTSRTSGLRVGGWECFLVNCTRPHHHCATGKFDVATTLSGMPVGTPGLLSQTIERWAQLHQSHLVLQQLGLHRGQCLQVHHQLLLNLGIHVQICANTVSISVAEARKLEIDTAGVTSIVGGADEKVFWWDWT